MIKYCTGNIFNSEADALVNPVNCVGKMGKGLALQFKFRYMDNFVAYEKACKRRQVKIGSVFITKTDGGIYIVNFPTKIHWKDSSQLKYLHLTLSSLKRELEKYPIKSIAIPKLGCGCGELNWSDVKPLIVQTFKDSKKLEVQIYE